MITYVPYCTFHLLSYEYISLESYRAPSYDELRQNKLYLNGMSPKFRPISQSETANKTQKMGKIAYYN